MIFLSDFLRADVVDVRQRAVGSVRDLIARIEEPFPVITAVALRPRGGRGALPATIDWSVVRMEEDGELSLGVATDAIPAYPQAEQSVWLARDILDKQIVDTEGRRVVRVNDLQLQASDGKLLVVGVDIGARGLLRRLGMERAARRLTHLARADFPQRVISWDAVDPVGSGEASLKLRISHAKLAKLHPADIAEIVGQLGGRDRAADILEAMSPDEAADLLADLSEERRGQLIAKMEADEAEDVTELLAYEEDTAGGLMTPDFVDVPVTLTAAKTIDRLRELEPDAESVYYVYVTDTDRKLLGVLSLRDLIVAKPDTPIREIMIPRVVAVSVDERIEAVAAVISKYNLLAVPVVDDEDRMLGIVTVDDAMEEVMPASVRRRARLL